MRARRIGPGGGLLAVALAFFALGPGAAAGTQAPRVLHGTFASFPDSIDPQLSYTFEGWNAMYDVYVPLLTYRHAEGAAGAEVIPGLARALPKITAGGRRYTLFLRPGLRYSNGQRVRASDFEFAVERMFALGSGGAPFYAVIAGARRFQRTRHGGISGIETDDATGKIVIRLTRPRNDFAQRLALPFVAPVPPNTPLRDQSSNPPPATGPYAITSSKPGIGWSYARNPQWSTHNGPAMPALPSGHVAAVQIDVVHDGSAQVDGVESGEFDWMQNPVPASRAAEVNRKYLGSQYRVDPTHSTYFFWMNTTRPPFDDLRVRRGVNYALDRRALQLIYSGQIAPTQQILPPGMPGYRKLRLYPLSMTKARALIRKADPSDREVTVWTDNESPNAEAGEYYAGVLRELGFKTHLKVLGADNYFSVIGNTRTPDLDTGWSDWFEDYPHPGDFFEPLLYGGSIFPFYNSNFAQIDAPSLNRRIEELSEWPGRTPKARYAALDRAYMKLAPWAPYGNRTLSTFVSAAIDLRNVVWNDTFGADIASFSFR